MQLMHPMLARDLASARRSDEIRRADRYRSVAGRPARPLLPFRRLRPYRAGPLRRRLRTGTVA